MTPETRLFAAVTVSAFVLAAIPTTNAAVTNTWNGSASSDWANGGNWSQSHAPLDGEHVVIPNAGNDPILSADSAQLASLTITNKTLTFTNWTTTLNATNVVIQDSGVLALPGYFYETAMSNRIHIACSDLTIQTGGSIDADEGGYAPWDGPGGGYSSSLYYHSGGSHGGRAGAGRRSGGGSIIASTYGDAAMPVQPGSGGGSYANTDHRSKSAGGGGAVYIDAQGTVTVHGTITADGGIPKLNDALTAGGSGGSIYIACDTFGGSTNGLIRARGGDALNTAAGGGGGGGRIAVDYQGLAAEHAVRFSASPARVDFAWDDPNDRAYIAPEMGTLWLPDTDLLSTTIDVNQFEDVRIMGPTAWTVGSLVVSNASVAFAEDGFVLTVGGDLRIDGGGALGLGYEWAGTNYTLIVGGDLIVTNGGELHVHSGLTNSPSRDYGALVLVSNSMIVGNASWVYPVSNPTNGAAPKFAVTNLYVAAGGGFNAGSRGFAPQTGPGSGGSTGNLYQDGAGHGGRGGANGKDGTDTVRGGATYGSRTAPILPGSGGTEYSTHWNSGGAGGGVIRIEAGGTVTVNGSLVADGGDSLYTHGAGGAGGSVYVRCVTFGGASSGFIGVDGGSIQPADVRQGGGGGGRIAIDYGALAAERAVRFSASPADREWTTINGEVEFQDFRAKQGTLWISDTGLLSSSLQDDQFRDVRLFGPTSWSVSSLTVSNCSLTFAEPGIEVAVTGDILVTTDGGLGIGDQSAGSNGALRCGGSLIVTNGGALYAYAGQTNGTGRDHGVLVAATNNLVVAPASRVYAYCHDTDGGAPRFEASSVSVAAGAWVCADNAGFKAATGPGKTLLIGSRTGGAGHGGRGGCGVDIVEGGFPYGSPYAPTLPGSGAGSHTSHSTMGGVGGGVVRMAASGTVTVDGTISADGMSSPHLYGGGGAGGSVYITCDTFGGSSSGLITATGGNPRGAAYSGGASGGRVAVLYQNLAATRDVAFSVAPADVSYAYGSPADDWAHIPRAGSLCFTDAKLLSDTLTDARFPGAVVLFFSSISDWSVDHLTVSNCSVAFGEDDFAITVSNDVVVTGDGNLGLGHYADGSNYTLRVGGNLLLTNNGTLTVFGGLTNAMGERTVSAVVSVTNDLIVRTGSWVFPVSHDTDGGSPVFRMQDLMVEQGGGFDADGKGYRCKTGPGAGSSRSSTGNGGGGYGGKGGDGTAMAGGGTYGQTNGPALPGSGGGCYHPNVAWTIRGGAGGGPVRIEARGDVSLAGTLTADGGSGLSYNTFSAGGAGGGIYILCSSFSGTASALLRAEGGDAFDQGTVPGGGGGGRIVVWQDVPESARLDHLSGLEVSNLVISTTFANYDGDVSVTNGIGCASVDPAQPGTAYFLRMTVGDSHELVVDGTPGDYDGPAPLGYGTHLDIPENSVVTNTVQTPADPLNGTRHACLGFTLEDYDNTPISNGTSPQIVFTLSTNMTLLWQWTNQYLLTASSATPTNGSVNSGAVNGWYTDQVAVAGIEATPSNGYAFLVWTGNYPPGHAADNPLTMTMDQPRTIQATFTPAVSETRIWSGTGSWDSDSNWAPPGVPTTLDHAIIGSGSCLVSNTKYVVSLVVSNGAELVFTNWDTTVHVNGDATILSNGTVTCAGPFEDTAMSNRVSLSSSNLTVAAGGSIDVDGKGWLAWKGPGAGGRSTGYYQSGGAYGGSGGHGRRDYVNVTFSTPYGSASQPLAPGSGAGSYDNTAHRLNGGAGGGAIRLDVEDALVVDGTITGDGAPAIGGDALAAGGSGGGVYITCGSFGGAGGVVQTRGGDPVNATGSGGGGGGRIALDYGALLPTHQVTFSASPADVDFGAANPDERWPHPARMGTLWLPDTNLLETTLIDGRFQDCSLVIAGVASLSLDSLTVSNTSFALAEDGFELHIANDLTIGAGASVQFGGYDVTGSDYALTVGGSLVVTNGGELHVHAGVTNGSTGPDGILVSVTNDMVIGPSSKIYAYCAGTNAATPRFAAANLRVAAGGELNADARGYPMATGPGKGVFTGSYWSGGAGHGGRGGSGAANATQPGSAHGGDMYGSAFTPTQPGSSANGYATHFQGAGSGGGVLRLEVQLAAVVNGTLSADGGPSLSKYSGAGAGGSVYLQCDTFGGEGLISACGGGSYSTNHAGPGGGGRIAVDYQSVIGPPGIRFSAQYGSNGYARLPTTGDLFWHLREEPGTVALPDTALLSDTLDQGRFAGAVKLHFADVSAWSVDHLTVSNCDVLFADDGFALTVTNTLQVSGASFGIGADEEGSGYALHAGQLVVTNGGRFYAYAGVTNSPTPGYGTLVDVDGAVMIAPSSWIHPVAHRQNGGTVLFRVGSLQVAAGGGLDANARGYETRLGPGKGTTSSTYPAGGGYGGRGGNGNYASSFGGSTYGSTNTPTQAGSAGGTHTSANHARRGGSGGGAVRIESSGAVQLLGTITADAGGGTYVNYGGGGSGGGIYLACSTLDSGSSSVLSAMGGDSWEQGGNAGAGGGGRIAVWHGGSSAQRAAVLAGGSYPGLLVTNDLSVCFDGTSSVTNGTGYISASLPEPGTTITYILPPPAGTIILIR